MEEVYTEDTPVSGMYEGQANGSFDVVSDDDFGCPVPSLSFRSLTMISILVYKRAEMTLLREEAMRKRQRKNTITLHVTHVTD